MLRSRNSSLVDIVKGINTQTCPEYYGLLDMILGEDRMMYDNRLDGHLIGSYSHCSELLTCKERLSHESADVVRNHAGQWHPQASRGKKILTRSIFLNHILFCFKKDERRLSST